MNRNESSKSTMQQNSLDYPLESAMALVSRRALCFFFISSLVALLVPRAYVQLGPRPEREIANMIASSSAKVSEQVKSRLSAKGFSTASIDGLQKSAQLCGTNLQAKLRSKIFWLLNLNHPRSQIAKAIATRSSEEAVQWLSEIGMAKKEVAKAIRTCPSVFCSTVEQNLELTVEWLLDVGLSHRQIVRIITSSPQTLEFSVEESNETLQLLLDRGVKKDKVAQIFARNPEILGFAVKPLHDSVEWLLDFGFTEAQIAKLIVSFPRILGPEEHLSPRVAWFLEVGLSKIQIAKTIVAEPSILGYSLDNLKGKVQWLVDLGLTKDQAVKVIVRRPRLFTLSVDKNLEPKRVLLQKVFGTGGAAEEVRKFPELLKFSYERLSSRLKVLVELNETWRLGNAMQMSEDRFSQVFAQRTKSKRRKDRRRVLRNGAEFSVEEHSETLQWLLDRGVKKDKATQIFARNPEILGFAVIELLLEFGFTEAQIAKLIVSFPRILGPEEHLSPRVAWFLEVGLSKIQIARVIVALPCILGYSLDNLKGKVQWLVDLGLTQDQAVKVIVRRPRLFTLSVDKNLEPKRVLLQKVFGTGGAAEEVRKFPQLLESSYERLSSRLKVLAERKETQKLRNAIVLSDDRFSQVFAQRTKSKGRKD